MKIIRLMLLLIIVASLCSAQGQWVTEVEIAVNAPGIIEAVLPPELHWRGASDRLDLALLDSDNNFRPFELFWKEAGDSYNIYLEPIKVQLRDDNRLYWKARFSQVVNLQRIQAFLHSDSYAGRVELQVYTNHDWQTVESDIAFEKVAGRNAAEIAVPGIETDQVRLIFAGLSRDFSDVPVFVSNVVARIKPSGREYHIHSFAPKYQLAQIENGHEIRVEMPGTGIYIENLEITSSAFFKGQWELGIEKLQLGKKYFVPLRTGQHSALSHDHRVFQVEFNAILNEKVLVLRMKSDDYFGKIDKVTLNSRLPRVAFAADETSVYTLKTGLNRPVSVLDKPSDDRKEAVTIVEVTDVRRNARERTLSLIENYSMRGGPFNPEGYTWKAETTVAKPGFYKLITDSQVNLDANPDSLRLVKDGVQVPYFLSSPELRTFSIPIESRYVNADNRSEYILNLTADADTFVAVQFKSAGIFDRQLRFERRASGHENWITWQSRQWKNLVASETVFSLSLRDFPADLRQIRLIIEHGNNSPIELTNFSGLYPAQDIFFVAYEAGDYTLYGGNDAVKPPAYDLALVQQQLFNMTPVSITHQPVQLDTAEKNSTAVAEAGASFDDTDYTWTTGFIVDTPGFYQIETPLRMALDNNRASYRLIKNDAQYPYFLGARSSKTIALNAAETFNEGKNTSEWQLSLPFPSKHWSKLNLTSQGIFNRKVKLSYRSEIQRTNHDLATAEWVSRTDSTTSIGFDLKKLPEDATNLKIEIAHGDNRRMGIETISGSYNTQDLFFYASETGCYRLFGGNPTAKAPKYDIALIQEQMFKTEPLRINPDPVVDYDGVHFATQVSRAFSEQGYGLYIILGLVTLILIGIIVVILPPADESDDDDEDEDDVDYNNNNAGADDNEDEDKDKDKDKDGDIA